MEDDERASFIGGLSEAEALAILYEWRVWARSNQVAPTDKAWKVWLLLAGRGFGKTRTGAEWVREQVESGKCRRLALVAPTAADVRDVMVEGESGILAISPPWFMPIYEPSKRRLTWPNGAIATCYSADEPDRLRGPQHDGAWADELAAWRYPDAWDQLMFGLRLGDDPRVVVTTTPRPTKLVKDLIKDPDAAITKGSTFDNLSNLASTFIKAIVKKYTGTRLGQQELYAAVLDDSPGALWHRDLLDANRVTDHPPLVRIVVAVDPAAGGDEEDPQFRPEDAPEDGPAETGIVAVGLGEDGVCYVLDDVSLLGTPDQWGKAVVTAYNKHEADLVVGEVNNGGQMVGFVIKTVKRDIPYKAVRATRGKYTRAEPVAALYEQGRVKHVGWFGPLEDQMCIWVPGEGKSPDRLDALVWAVTELMVDTTPEPRARRLGRRRK